MLCGGGTKDILQPLVHLAHPSSGGCEQCIQKCGCSGHVLASLGKGGELPLRMINRHGAVCLKRRFTLMQVGQSCLNGHPLVDELAPSLCDFVFNVVL
jgi:hypothetical protein